MTAMRAKRLPPIPAAFKKTDIILLLH